jgi:hypothetical protein
MIDIMERLRFDAVRCEIQFSKGVAGNIEEAADEIEKVREWHKNTTELAQEYREEIRLLSIENERLLVALKPFADEIDMLKVQGVEPPPERILMFASDGGGTFMGIQMSKLYEAHRVCQQLGSKE